MAQHPTTSGKNAHIYLNNDVAPLAHKCRTRITAAIAISTIAIDHSGPPELRRGITAGSWPLGGEGCGRYSVRDAPVHGMPTVERVPALLSVTRAPVTPDRGC